MRGKPFFVESKIIVAQQNISGESYAAELDDGSPTRFMNRTRHIVYFKKALLRMISIPYLKEIKRPAMTIKKAAMVGSAFS